MTNVVFVMLFFPLENRPKWFRVRVNEIPGKIRFFKNEQHWPFTESNPKSKSCKSGCPGFVLHFLKILKNINPNVDGGSKYASKHCLCSPKTKRCEECFAWHVSSEDFKKLQWESFKLLNDSSDANDSETDNDDENDDGQNHNLSQDDEDEDGLNLNQNEDDEDYNSQ